MQKVAMLVVGGALAIAGGVLLANRPGGWLGWVIGGALLVGWIMWIFEVVEGTRGFSREFRRRWREKA